MGIPISRPDIGVFRRINVCLEGHRVSKEQAAMSDNGIVTSKYNLITFVPRSLFEQFRRIANIYFLVISVLMVLGTFTDLFSSPLEPYSTLLPLVFVLTVTMVKDGVEDLKRHKSDKKVNNTLAHALCLDRAGDFEDVKWMDLRVGRIVRVVDKEEIPADLVLLTTSEANGVAYIETANIDGETNLKIRSSAPTRDGDPPGPEWRAPSELHGVPMELEYEAPNPRIHFFTGTLSIPRATGGSEGDLRGVAVDQSHLLLRGSRLRNTKWALGLVVYTGKESKISQNARSAPSKQSNLDKVTNKIMFVIFFAMAMITTISLIGFIIFNSEYEDELFYLCFNSDNAPIPLFRNNCVSTSDSGDAGQWFTFLILFNNFIPISLYVTLEMVNAIQSNFIDEDQQMYDQGQDTPAAARSSNMNADLGQVEYIFSDKTGTLTQNVMKFKRCSVEGQVYGEITAADKALMTKTQLEHVVEAPPLDHLGRKVMADAKSGKDSGAVDFALCLALNHTVVLETDPDSGERSMQAESPDEEALVDGAKMLGLEFIDRTPGKVVIDVEEVGERTFDLMLTIPFNSTRKRMSVVVKDQEGNITLYCKGADNIIMDRASSFMSSDKAIMEKHLGVFANDGLRTLLLARKKLSQDFFDGWYARYREASIATEGRTEKLAEVAKDVEVDLEVVGATAIEDKLQDEVPSTIADLGKAGVKLWVLTGDKMETAINIGYSCRLLVPEMTVIKLKEKEGDPKSVERQLEALMTHFSRLVADESLFDRLWGSMKASMSNTGQSVNNRRGGGNAPGNLGQAEEGGAAEALPEPLLEQPEGAPPLSELTSDALALVVDGPSLTHVLGNPEAERMFLALGGICKSVVACRVSPAQKRLIVRLVKRGVKPTPITLAIGDGANDVGMIQEAQLGVGISGKEGRQAVNNADFAIAQFRFLKRLMLVHGHWDYRRLCKVIMYSFYKNIVLTFMLFYFCIYTGWSGQSLVESLVYSGFNWFLAMPILCVGLYDQDVSEQVALSVHKLYGVGRLNLDLNVKVMVKNMIQAILDSLIMFFLPFGAYSDARTLWAERGYADGLFVFGTTAYSCLIVAMMYRAFNLTQTWNRSSLFFFVGSFLLFFGFVSAYSFNSSYAYDFYHVGVQTFSRPTYWLLVFQVPFVSWMVDAFIRMVEHSFYPNVGHYASEFDRGYTSPEGLEVLKHIKRRVPDLAEAQVGAQPVEEAAPKRDDMLQKWHLGAASLKVLNESVGRDELEELGLTSEEEAYTRSSYAYDHPTADYGRGASDVEGEMLSIVSEEGEEGIHRRASSIRQLEVKEEDTSWEEKA